MPILKELDTKNTGAAATFWVLSKIIVMPLVQEAYLTVAGYLSAEAMGAGKNPVEEIEIYIGPAGFPSAESLAGLLTPAEDAILADSRFTGGTKV